MKEKCYLTVDFEDFTHDFKRRVLYEKDPTINKESLNKSYEYIKNLLNKLNNIKITFFCAGILAKKYPDIISKIANDGHEIACHYFYDDDVNKENIYDFEKNIKEAIFYLEKASNQKTIGFRAPRFSVNMDNVNHYKIINKYFKYDSSLNTLNKNKVLEFKKINQLNNLTFFPVPTFTFLKKIKYKSGGTFFKFFPFLLTDQLLMKAVKKKIIPIVYIHPYEFENGKNFKITFNQLKLPLLERLYWLIRQTQWLNFMNFTTSKKLFKLQKKYVISGMLKNNL
jgi:peptidoglycan/xylan/chitin deacetylase (PgdA/CDA1 family)|tara:strand:- start:246 stop:1091 length:846 start_codon:yes stop_codon:yes gene_type:complete